MPKSEQTFIMVKPDGVQRGLVSKIFQRFEERGYKLVALKMMMPSKTLIEKHYDDLKTKPFFGGLVQFTQKGPVVCSVWEGLDVVRQGRTILGETNPLQSPPGSIRGDYCTSIGRNVVHGSDSVETAKKEIHLWFKEEEMVKWEHCSSSWINE